MRSLNLLLLFITQSFSPLLFAQGGTLDNTFSGNGKQVSNFPTTAAQGNSVTVQRDSSIVVAGQYVSGQNQWGLLYSFALVRYLKNGPEDPNFGSGGRVYLSADAPFCNIPSVILQPDNKILAAGFVTTETTASPFLYLVRLEKDGTIDQTFNHGTPILAEDFTGVQVLLQTDGRIIVAANWYGPDNTITNDTWYAALRFNSDGTPDLSYGVNGQTKIKIGSTPTKGLATCAVLQKGKLLISGSYNTRHIITARFNTDGSSDATFGKKGLADVTVNNTDPCNATCMTVQADSRILIGGSFTSASGPTDFLAVRLMPNGPLDSSFAGNGKKAINFNGTDEARGIAFNKDGTIILGGVTTPHAQPKKFALCELNTDGSPDLLFGPNNDGKSVAGWANVNGDAYGLALAPDRKIVMAGSYYSNTIPDEFAVMRFLPRFQPPIIILGDAAKSIDGSTPGLTQSSPHIYPNPATDQLQIAGLPPATPQQVSVVDASGRLWITLRLQGKDHTTLDIARLMPGSYTVILTGADGTHSLHFLKLAH